MLKAHRIRLQHMFDAANEAVSSCEVELDLIWTETGCWFWALKGFEIIGEAANKISD